MLCKECHPVTATTTAGYDTERVDRIRDKIRMVFGSDCAIDDFELLKRYSLTGSGELVMIVRGFR